MNKFFFGLIYLVHSLVGLNARVLPSAAPGIEKPLPPAMAFARIGAFRPSDSYFKEIYGSGLVPALEGRIRIIKDFYFSLEGGYLNKTGLLTLTKEKTTLTIVPLGLAAVYQIRLSGDFSPYLGAGISVCPYTEKNVLGKDARIGCGPAFCGGLTARFGHLGADIRLKYSSVKIKPFDVEADLGGLDLSLAFGCVF